MSKAQQRRTRRLANKLIRRRRNRGTLAVRVGPAGPSEKAIKRLEKKLQMQGPTAEKKQETPRIVVPTKRETRDILKDIKKK